MKTLFILFLYASCVFGQQVFSRFDFQQDTKTIRLEYIQVIGADSVKIAEFKYSNGRVTSQARNEVMIDSFSNVESNIIDLESLARQVILREWQSSGNRSYFENIERAEATRAIWRLSMGGVDTRVVYNKNTGRTRFDARGAIDYSFRDYLFYVEKYKGFLELVKFIQ